MAVNTITVQDLRDALSGYDGTMRVVIRVADPEGFLQESEADGENLVISNADTSVLVEGGDLVIIGDVAYTE